MSAVVTGRGVLFRPVLKWTKQCTLVRRFTNGRTLLSVERPDDDPDRQATPDLDELLRNAEIRGDEEHEKTNQNINDDWNEFNKRRRNQSKWSFRPNVDPRKTSIILFPGQGSQFVGMAESLLEYPEVPKMFKIAKKILGYDLLDLCMRGPKRELDSTVYCQPAVFVTSLAAIEKLKHQNPAAVENCISTAGFSVGEFAALTFAGVMSFEEGLYVVNERAKAMQEASLAAPSGMMTVIESPRSKLKFACMAAREYCRHKLEIEDPVCNVANFLFTQCKVVAGHDQALDFMIENRRDFGLRMIKRLPVSGAFHTPLMRYAEEPLRRAFGEVSLESPIIPVQSNVTSRPHRNKPEMIVKEMVEQLTKPVKWEQILHTLYTRSPEDHFPHTFEMGPGSQLCTILGKTNKRAAEVAKAIKV